MPGYAGRPGTLGTGCFEGLFQETRTITLGGRTRREMKIAGLRIFKKRVDLQKSLALGLILITPEPMNEIVGDRR